MLGSTIAALVLLKFDKEIRYIRYGYYIKYPYLYNALLIMYILY
jgi:hypothetical protein